MDDDQNQQAVGDTSASGGDVDGGIQSTGSDRKTGMTEEEQIKKPAPEIRTTEESGLPPLPSMDAADDLGMPMTETKAEEMKTEKADTFEGGEQADMGMSSEQAAMQPPPIPPLPTVPTPPPAEMPFPGTPPMGEAKNKNNRNLVIGGVAVLAALAIGIPLAAMNLGLFSGDVRQRASEPTVTPIPQQIVPTTETEEEEVVPEIVSDVSNSDWIGYQPNNVQAVLAEPFLLKVSFDAGDEDLGGTYSWVVGYWNESFDPVDVYARWEPYEPIIRYRRLTSANFDFESTERQLRLELDDDLIKTGTVYYALIRRVEMIDGQFMDFIYGQGGNPKVPFSMKVK